MSLKFRYDAEADAAYLRLSADAIVETAEVSPGVNFDTDVESKIVGIEVLCASERLPPDVLK